MNDMSPGSKLRPPHAWLSKKPSHSPDAQLAEMLGIKLDDSVGTTSIQQAAKLGWKKVAALLVVGAGFGACAINMVDNSQTQKLLASQAMTQKTFDARLRQGEEVAYYKGQADGFAAYTCIIVNNMTRLSLPYLFGGVKTDGRAETCHSDGSKLHKFVFGG